MIIPDCLGSLKSQGLEQLLTQTALFRAPEHKLPPDTTGAL